MLRALITAVSLAAILVGGVVILGGPAARFGLWEYGDGLKAMRVVAPYALGLAAAAALAFVLALVRVRGLALLALAGLIIAGAGGYAPLKMRQLAKSNPFIHDITTDFDDPPAIVAAAALPRKNPPDYVGAEPVRGAPEGVTVADAQRAAFPDIAPLSFDADPESVAAAARKVADRMGMKTLAQSIEAQGIVIEATYTSFWYGFVDDFIIRIVASEGGGARVDLRSKSRVGGSDLGANAARVREFSRLMRAEIA